MNLKQAKEIAETYRGLDSHIDSMLDRFPDYSENKAMRWLGYMQGVLVERGIFTLNEVKDHSRIVVEKNKVWSRSSDRDHDSYTG